jgi:Dolichyl-phosphate-mannose-protein mannosyltransferase
MSHQAATGIQTTEEQEQIRAHAPAAGVARSATGRATFSTAVLPAILLVVYLVQCAWFIQSQSLTFDEPTDISAGLGLWRTGQYSGGEAMNDHPPLARLLCTLPAISTRFQIGDKVAPNAESVAWRNSDFTSFDRLQPSPEAIAWHTRPVDALLGAGLGLLLWLAARSVFSAPAANFVLALFAFSPSLIAHFSLGATNDGVMTLMFLATVFQLYRWRRDPSRLQTVLLGLVLGGLLITKASVLPFFGLALVFMLVLKPGSIAIRPTEWNWGKALVALVLSCVVVWGAYRFHVSKVSLAVNDTHLRVVIPNRPDPIVRESTRAFGITVPVPALEYVQGLAYQIRHAGGGHYGFLLGRPYVGGSKLFFPMVVLLKWPTIVLLLFLASLGLLVLRRNSLSQDFALWAVFPVLYFFLAVFAKLNLGERYILPVYPFALLLCGSLWQRTSRRRAIPILLLSALILHVGDVLRYSPDYLSYFNLFVRPTNSYQLLSDSNVDWGEGLIALRNYQREHPSVPIHLAYFGSVAPDAYGVKAIPLMPGERASGTVIVSANFLSGQTLPDPDSYHWVLQYPLKSILNHSLYVFEVGDQVNPAPVN